jgi:hypothetical protein
MYHLLIERVSTVTSGFVQCRARVWVEFNRAGIERVVGRTGLFTSLRSVNKACGYLPSSKSSLRKLHGLNNSYTRVLVRLVNKTCLDFIFGSFGCETACTYRAVKLIMWLVIYAWLFLISSLSNIDLVVTLFLLVNQLTYIYVF